MVTFLISLVYYGFMKNESTYMKIFTNGLLPIMILSRFWSIASKFVILYFYFVFGKMKALTSEF